MSIVFLFLGMALQSGDPYLSPPELRKKEETCVCPATAQRADVTVSGYVVDAQMVLAADGYSMEDRMATIFDVAKSSNGEYSGRTKIWHNISNKACGVTFDYGKKYSVPARVNDDGDLETDQCLMGQ